MTSTIKKLIEDIDQLAIWLRDNPNMPIPSQYKQKAQVVLQKIINAEVLSDQEWARLKPEIHKPICVPNQKQNPKPIKRKPQKSKVLSKVGKKKKKPGQPRAQVFPGGLPGSGKR